MNQNKWNYDDLDRIFFKQTENQQGYRSPKKVSGLGKLGERIYKGDEGKFLKDLQECLNWEKPQDEITDCYTNMMRIGYQPELMQLNQLETIDEQKEWKYKKDQKLQEEIRREIREEAIQEAQRQRHLEWKKEQEAEKIQRQKTKELEQRNCSPSHRRTVTFDMANVSTQSSQISQVHQPVNTEYSSGQFNLKIHKANESPCRMSERSITTAATSNYRSTQSSSPNKLNRKKINFTMAANNIMNSTNLDISIMDIERDDMSRRSTYGPQSPDVRSKGNRMPGQSLFDFSIKGLNYNRQISSSRCNRCNENKLNHNEKCHESQQNLRMSNLMNQEYSSIQNQMINKQ